MLLRRAARFRWTVSAASPRKMDATEPAAKRRKITGPGSGQPPSEWQTVSEESVGITEFSSPDAPGFSGIVKHRYSDFMVREIEKNNNVVRLLSLTAGVDQQKEEAMAPTKDTLEDDDFSNLASLVGDEATKQVRDCWNQREAEGFKATTCADIVTDPVDDKTKRTAIHEAFKSLFGTFFITTTQDKKILIKVKGSSGAARGSWGKPSASRSRQEFCEFTLYKENKDTMEAINILAKILRAQVRLFSFAGTKDKRAVTTQKVTVHKITASKLASLNAKLLGLRVGDFRYVPAHLMFGDLNGNRFTVFLRNVVAPEDDIAKALKSLEERGFVNYFGLQRFGTGPIGTHTVGKEILRGNFTKAVELLLSAKDNDSEEAAAARKQYQDKEYKNAARTFPKRFMAEKAILQYFGDKGHENDAHGALLRIPRSLRMMYLHAYQSFVWNKLVSYRLQQHGHEVVIGDLVLADGAASAAKVAGTLDEYVIPEEGAEEQVTDAAEGDEASGERSAAAFVDIKVIETEEEAAKYNVFDVVLPLPGYNVKYPSNCLEKVKSIMTEDGLDPEDMKRPQKEFSLSGAYRALLSRAQDLSWKTIRYSNPNADVCVSDLSVLKGAKDGPISEDEGQWLGVLVEFSLPPSSYATMLLRELTKQQSDVAFQAGLQH